MKISIFLPVLLFSTIAFSQRSPFNIIDYLLPRELTTQEPEEMKVLSIGNKKNHSYCVITVLEVRSVAPKLKMISMRPGMILLPASARTRPKKSRRQLVGDGWFRNLNYTGPSVNSK